MALAKVFEGLQDEGHAWGLAVPHRLQARGLRRHRGGLVHPERDAVFILPRQDRHRVQRKPQRDRRRGDENHRKSAAPETHPCALRAPPEVALQQAFLKRVKENDKKKQEAKARGETLKCKREPEGPKAMKIVKAKEDEVEVLAPLPFIENYF
eukprot:CAMPEP_0117498710 /NCGR_PEP_ID=MMETSP0784-20121206/21856_1 /TAXON_ID=39447 /ORGANISM="" /LENGTH=152 /DNA_ID=CAMNT_0005293807 /DNA_START=119 /DNA_END=579 /DNA_ORIENTATION=+